MTFPITFPITSFIRWIVPGVAGKTSWEWLELLFVPVLLAGGAFYLNDQSEKRQESIATERAQQETLISYFDQMKELLLSEGLRKSPADSEVRSVARAITSITIKDVDGEHNALVISFLRESNLLEKPESVSPPQSKEIQPVPILAGLNLFEADLNRTDLIDANLSGANLTNANLSGAALFDANLNSAFLNGVHLQDANLKYADLSRAYISGTDLQHAHLSNADLHDAVLRGSNLHYADMSGVNLNGADLSGAYLFYAKNLTKEQLEQALLCKTRFPKEIDLDPDRDCKKLKEKE
jgi:uncharacterized protein YjbI with pentapeptide repeats